MAAVPSLARSVFFDFASFNLFFADSILVSTSNLLRSAGTTSPALMLKMWSSVTASDILTPQFEALPPLI